MQRVGWVERSETHHWESAICWIVLMGFTLMGINGYRFYPSYVTLRLMGFGYRLYPSYVTT
ncbi:MAG: hypothetical protein Kow0065_14360 [Methylomicrobium sp.]